MPQNLVRDFILPCLTQELCSKAIAEPRDPDFTFPSLTTAPNFLETEQNADLFHSECRCEFYSLQACLCLFDDFKGFH